MKTGEKKKHSTFNSPFRGKTSYHPCVANNVGVDYDETEVKVLEKKLALNCKKNFCTAVKVIG